MLILFCFKRLNLEFWELVVGSTFSLLLCEDLRRSWADCSTADPRGYFSRLRQIVLGHREEPEPEERKKNRSWRLVCILKV
ncbi:hypothetical protein L1987_66131 [Smallanthus sonchifolius]|uniref:Uncharacterized protein n=1 Tax=Smallanthus sonchifolius TaxID=185202 RepID=A0ACB9BWA9_9ASTR|nr:hypothetical protein L1987_66131 [Smallanthus sonchifolius]